MCRPWFAVAALPVLTAPVAAQPVEAFELVPADALGFVLIGDLRHLGDRAAALAKKLKAPERGSALDLVQQYTGVRNGLNETGSAVLILLDGKSGQPAPGYVAALPVRDAPQVFRDLGVKTPRDGSTRARSAPGRRCSPGPGQAARGTSPGPKPSGRCW